MKFGVELVIGVELARAKTESWPFRGASMLGCRGCHALIVLRHAHPGGDIR
jgi:hypothetical protein